MKKKFDCVRMKREIQERIMAETRGMSDAQVIEYFRRRARSSGPMWEKFRAARRADRPAPPPTR